MNACAGKRLDPGRKSPESMGFERGLRRKILGQAEALQALIDLYQVFRAGLNSPGRPVGIAASGRWNTFNAEALLQMADEALYRAKQMGPNRVELAVPLDDTDVASAQLR